MKKEKETKGEKVSAPVHKRKKGNKKKQASKQQVREKLAKLQNEVLATQEKPSVKKDVKKEPEKTLQNNKNHIQKDKKPNKKVHNKSNKPHNAKNKAPFVPTIAKDVNAKVRIIPLGGLNEIGKNITAIECGDDIIVIAQT